MPIVKIEEQGPRSADEKARLVTVLFDAIKDTLGVNAAELQARYRTYPADDFFAPPGATGYVAIEISLFAGRSLDTKRALYARIARDVAALRAIDAAHVLVLLHEAPFENWGLHGGRAATDITFDYAIEI